MLKVEKSATDALVIFAVSGEIAMDEVAELRRVLASEPSVRKVLDLKDVTIVDRDAVMFLADCETDRIELKNCPRFIRQWIVRERGLG